MVLKGLGIYMVDTCAFKELRTPYFGVYACTVTTLEHFENRGSCTPSCQKGWLTKQQGPVRDSSQMQRIYVEVYLLFLV